MQTDFLDTDQVRQQATVAGFSKVEEYVLNLLRQDRERQAVFQGLAEIEAGKGRPFEEFAAEFRKRHSIPTGE